MKELKNFLNILHPGKITGKNLKLLEPLLARCWHLFKGSGQEGMEGSKLLDRMGNISWHPPYLYFTIERHGGTAMGSSRATLHDWKVDIAERTAEIINNSYRQVRPRQENLDIEPLARDIVNKIRSGEPDPQITRIKNGDVKIEIGKIIPDAGPKQTVASRRKRFRKRLESLLTKDHRKIGPNRYRPLLK